MRYVKSSKSLHGRFRSAIVGVASVMLVIVAAFVYWSAKTSYMNSAEASARAMVAAVEQSVAAGAYADDRVLLAELVEGLARHPSVARVAVVDPKGALLASTPNTAVNARMPTIETVLTSPFDAHDTSGRLRVWLDAERMSKEATRQAAVVVGALTVLLATVLAIFNSLADRLLSRPMHELAEELSGIEPGSSKRIALEQRHDRDEVGVVTNAANRLLDLQQSALERERRMREEIASMEARYRGIFDSTSAGIFIMSGAGELLHANPAMDRLMSAEACRSRPTEFVGLTFGHPAMLDALVATARASGQPEAADLELVVGDGAERWVHCMVSFVGEEGDGARVEGVLYDITRRRHNERLAQHSAEHDALTGLKSRAYIEAALDRHIEVAHGKKSAVTLMFIDLDGFKSVNDRWGHAAGDAVLVEAARRLREMFKRSGDIVGRLGGDELVILIDDAEADDSIVSSLAHQLIDAFKSPFVLPEGAEVHVGASVGVASYPANAMSAKTLIQAADAAMYAVKQSGKGGVAMAGEAARSPSRDVGSFDPLTGLPDRRELERRLGFAHAKAASGAGWMAVVCLDIYQFRSFNLAHGNRVGDELLRQTAARLIASVRREDTVARTGSDEFVCVVPIPSSDRRLAATLATEIADKLLRAVTGPVEVGSHTLLVKGVAGVSLMGESTANPGDALREAQLSLRRAKSVGQGAVVLFEADMMAGFHERLTLEEDLRAAIGTDQFSLHVQPQVNDARRICGGEALLRWRHPVRGNVPPDQFIPVAESCGAIVELGRWVLRSGCDILAGIARVDPRMTLSVNISPAQFMHADFVADVRQALAESCAQADRLILEITEGLLITDIDEAKHRLEELVALGVRFSIDDFGTGFSSLSYLRQLPLHEIKIDRSFMAGLPSDAASSGIVRSILSMGQHLGLQVVAEGVEEDEQSNFLAEHGCDVQQGWLHGRPVPVADFTRLLENAARGVAVEASSG
jgi:diguanylate cyclase (GGDEF)-like protein/PAS domain S-box-containing protein